MKQSHRLKKSGYLVATILTLLIGNMMNAQAQQASFDKDRLTKIDELINRHIAAKHIPGATALIISNGQVVYNKAFGYADVETKRKMQVDDIFRIASQSKAITSLAVMMLWEEGKFLLDDPLSKYIPAFKDPRVLLNYNAKDGNYTTRPASREIYHS